MIALMKYFKPYLFHSGAVISLADRSGKTQLQRVEQASNVMQAHDLFGLREHIGAVLSLSEPHNVGAEFGKRIITVLNGADKVASICTDLAVFQLMVLGASTNCAYGSQTEQRLGTSCEMCCSAILRRTGCYRLL
jgi:hypothetical protein